MNRLLYIFFLFLPALAWGQKDDWESTKHFNGKWGTNLSYSYQIHSALEIGRVRYLFATIESGGEMPHYYTDVKNNWSVGTSLEFVIGQHFIFGTKLFSNLTYKWFSAQLNITAFTDFKNIDPVVTPELGIGNWIGIRYGYNLHLIQNSFSEIGNHKLTIFIKFYSPHFNVPR